MQKDAATALSAVARHPGRYAGQYFDLLHIKMRIRVVSVRGWVNYFLGARGRTGNSLGRWGRGDQKARAEPERPSWLNRTARCILIGNHPTFVPGGDFFGSLLSLARSGVPYTCPPKSPLFFGTEQDGCPRFANLPRLSRLAVELAVGAYLGRE